MLQHVALLLSAGGCLVLNSRQRQQRVVLAKASRMACIACMAKDAGGNSTVSLQPS